MAIRDEKEPREWHGSVPQHGVRRNAVLTHRARQVRDCPVKRQVLRRHPVVDRRCLNHACRSAQPVGNVAGLPGRRSRPKRPTPDDSEERGRVRRGRSCSSMSLALIRLNPPGQWRIVWAVPGFMEAILRIDVGVSVHGTATPVGGGPGKIRKNQHPPTVHWDAVLVGHIGRRVMPTFFRVSINRTADCIQLIQASIGVVYPRRDSMGQRHNNQPGRDNKADHERCDRTIDEDHGCAAHDACKGVADPGVTHERQADLQESDGPPAGQSAHDEGKCGVSSQRC